MEDTVVIPILQMRELKHPVTKWKSWDLYSGILAADLVLSIPTLCSLPLRLVLRIGTEGNVFFSG